MWQLSAINNWTAGSYSAGENAIKDITRSFNKIEYRL